MIHAEYLIVGQGIAGTLLAIELMNQGKSVVMLDDEHSSSSSKVAAGIINPITGRNYVKSWMIDPLLEESKIQYSAIEKEYDVQCIRALNILRCLHTPKEENMWSERMFDPLYENFMGRGEIQIEKVLSVIHAPLSFGEIKNALQIDLNAIIKAFREHMLANNKLVTTTFSFDALTIGNAIKYEDIHTEKIVFSEGYKVIDNPYFNYLPFDPVKGEVLIIEISDGFDINLRDKQFITPIGNNHYWCGSGYKWQFENAKPTAEGKLEIEKQLDAIFKVPYKIVDHMAAVRPATKTRKPIMGLHPEFKNVFIFNGLGTKGTSLGPYFAKHFCSFLTSNTSVLRDVDINIF